MPLSWRSRCRGEGGYAHPDLAPARRIAPAKSNPAGSAAWDRSTPPADMPRGVPTRRPAPSRRTRQAAGPAVQAEPPRRGILGGLDDDIRGIAAPTLLTV